MINKQLLYFIFILLILSNKSIAQDYSFLKIKSVYVSFQRGKVVPNKLLWSSYSMKPYEAEELTAQMYKPYYKAFKLGFTGDVNNKFTYDLYSTIRLQDLEELHVGPPIDSPKVIIEGTGTLLSLIDIGVNVNYVKTISTRFSLVPSLGIQICAPMIFNKDTNEYIEFFDNVSIMTAYRGTKIVPLIAFKLELCYKLSNKVNVGLNYNYSLQTFPNSKIYYGSKPPNSNSFWNVYNLPLTYSGFCVSVYKRIKKGK
jgi:hypothetical protein